MNTIGLALGGGAARGIAHVGVLRALRSRPRFVPDFVAGTSAGSIVATLYAAGIEQERLEEIVRDFDWLRNVVSVNDTARSLLDSKHDGLVSNLGLEDTINELIDGRTFDRLPRELAVVATDLERGQRVLFVSTRMKSRLDQSVLEAFLPAPVGDLPGSPTRIVYGYENVGRAVAASCAVPGIFVPVEVDDMRLVDGGVVDQVPVDVAVAMGAEPVIGVSLSFTKPVARMKTLGAAFSNVINMLGTQQLRRSLDLADVGFQIPGIEDRSLIDVRQYDLLELGEQTMIRYFVPLEKCLKSRERLGGKRLIKQLLPKV